MVSANLAIRDHGWLETAHAWEPVHRLDVNHHRAGADEDVGSEEQLGLAVERPNGDWLNGAD